jgi:death-on-curing protein
MIAPVFLTLEQALAIHARVVEEFGGDPGVRDFGLLASALSMPAAQYEGKFLHPDLAAMAAAYLFHLCRNHPFVDGNKRTALAAAEIFLILNGKELISTNRELEQLTLDLAAGQISKIQATVFFRQHIK